jgi:SAM-dependent methyltransferase
MQGSTHLTAADPDLLEREREHTDAMAAEMDPAAMPFRDSGAATIFEDRIVEVLGDVEGKRILDLCCGAGDLTLRLLKRGAHVTALDLSPGIVAVARERAARYVPEADGDFIAAPAEASGLDSDSFDWVVGLWALHHTEVDASSSEIHRVLKPEGRAVFIETSALNPLLRFARRRLVGRWGIRQFGTPDEHPITKDDLQLLEGKFRKSVVDFPHVMFLSMLDRHIFNQRSPRLTELLMGADRLIQRRMPRLAKASYLVRIQLQT